MVGDTLQPVAVASLTSMAIRVAYGPTSKPVEASVEGTAWIACRLPEESVTGNA